MSTLEPWILTRSGRRVYPLDPKPEMIDLGDIAHALANICRFCGHTSRFYSVAEHSLLVASHVAPQFALWGLLHDASEAYLADLAKPIKHLFPNFIDAEQKIMDVVCLRFGLLPIEPEPVKAADTRALVTEARDLMGADWGHLGKPFQDTIWTLPHPSTDPEWVSALFHEKFIEFTKEVA